MSVQLTRGLVLVNLLLLAGVVVLWLFMPSRWAAPAPLEPATASLAPSSSEKPVLAYSADAVFQRPLFSATRQPFPAVELEPEKTDEPVEAAPRTPPPKLTGMFSDGDASGAIVVIDSVPQRMSVGQEVGGWRLLGVNSQEAVFIDSADRRHTVQFPKPGTAVAEPTQEQESPQRRPARR